MKKILFKAYNYLTYHEDELRQDLRAITFFILFTLLLFLNGGMPDVTDFKTDEIEQPNNNFISLKKSIIQSDIKRTITTNIVIHHTASEKPSNMTDEQYIKSIETFHITERKYRTLAYHIMVINDKVYVCQDLNNKIAGVANMNSKTLNVCIVGNFNKRKPTDTELETLIGVIDWIKTKAYRYPKVCYHSDLNNTDCCGEYLKVALLEKGNWF